MSRSDRMSPLELRASIALAGIFGLRLLGMFVILPVFAIYAEQLPGGNNLTLVGIAIGAYGLTQAILQIPFGWWSDRYGRKPVIYVGLALFAVGSFVAAGARSLRRDRRPRPAGRGRDLGGGHGDGRGSDARGAPHQGDGDDRLDDRPRVRVVARCKPVAEPSYRRAGHLCHDRRPCARSDARRMARRSRRRRNSRAFACERVAEFAAVLVDPQLARLN